MALNEPSIYFISQRRQCNSQRKTKQQIERENTKKGTITTTTKHTSFIILLIFNNSLNQSPLSYPPPTLSSCTAVSSHVTDSFDICNPLATSNLPSNEAVRFCLTMLCSISLSSRVFQINQSSLLLKYRFSSNPFKQSDLKLNDKHRQQQPNNQSISKPSASSLIKLAAAGSSVPSLYKFSTSKDIIPSSNNKVRKQQQESFLNHPASAAYRESSWQVSSDSLRADALAYFQSKDYNISSQLYEQLCRSSNTTASNTATTLESWVNYSQSLLFSNKSLEGLVTLLSGLIECSSTSTDQAVSHALCVYAQCLFDLQQFDTAVYICQQACRLNPEYYSILSRMCIHGNRPVDAMRYILKDAEAEKPVNSLHQILLTSISAAYDLKLYALSLKFAETLALLAHAQPHGFMLAACAAQALGDDTKAKQLMVIAGIKENVLMNSRAFGQEHGDMNDGTSRSDIEILMHPEDFFLKRCVDRFYSNNNSDTSKESYPGSLNASFIEEWSNPQICSSSELTSKCLRLQEILDSGDISAALTQLGNLRLSIDSGVSIQEAQRIIALADKTSSTLLLFAQVEKMILKF